MNCGILCPLHQYPKCKCKKFAITFVIPILDCTQSTSNTLLRFSRVNPINHMKLMAAKTKTSHLPFFITTAVLTVLIATYTTYKRYQNSTIVKPTENTCTIAVTEVTCVNSSHRRFSGILQKITSLPYLPGAKMLSLISALFLNQTL